MALPTGQTFVILTLRNGEVRLDTLIGLHVITNVVVKMDNTWYEPGIYTAWYGPGYGWGLTTQLGIGGGLTIIHGMVGD